MKKSKFINNHVLRYILLYLILISVIFIYSKFKSPYFSSVLIAHLLFIAGILIDIRRLRRKEKKEE